MARTWYLAHYEKQLTGSACGPYNCNMSAAAMATQQVSLGAINTDADKMRHLSGTWSECTDKSKVNDGTSIQDAATAMARLGVHLSIFDSFDRKDFPFLVAHLKKGRFAVVHGDYDQVPVKLRGDKDFLGLHSVYYQEYRESVPLFNGTKGPGIRVGDGLNDHRHAGIPNGYVWWPLAVARNYALKFPGGGLTFGLIDRRWVTSRVDVTNVRARPDTNAAIIAKFKSSDPGLTWGAVQIGTAVGGDRRWYRVWEPVSAKIGYVHASVVRSHVDSGE